MTEKLTNEQNEQEAVVRLASLLLEMTGPSQGDSIIWIMKDHDAFYIWRGRVLNALDKLGIDTHSDKI